MKEEKSVARSLCQNKTNEGLNPFILSTASDYDMTYEAVEVYYNKYGSTPMFYEMLEEHIKMRSF